MPIELKWQEPRRVEEGKHTARIASVERRFEPYDYIDVYYALEDTDVTIKEGYPALLSEASKLGKLLTSLGFAAEVNTLLDLEAALVGKHVTLLTINEPIKDGRVFARVVDGSVKMVPQ